MWALSNITADSYQFRDIIISADGFRIFHDTANSKAITPGLARICVWYFSNLVRWDPKPA